MVSYEDIFNAPVVLAQPLAPGERNEDAFDSENEERQRSRLFKWFRWSGNRRGSNAGLADVPVLETREERALPIGCGHEGDEYFETYVYDERTGTEVAVAGIELVQKFSSENDHRDDLDALAGNIDSDDEGSVHGIHYGELVDAVELEAENRRH